MAKRWIWRRHGGRVEEPIPPPPPHHGSYADAMFAPVELTPEDEEMIAKMLEDAKGEPA